MSSLKKKHSTCMVVPAGTNAKTDHDDQRRVPDTHRPCRQGRPAPSRPSKRQQQQSHAPTNQKPTPPLPARHPGQHPPPQPFPFERHKSGFLALVSLVLGLGVCLVRAPRAKQCARASKQPALCGPARNMLQAVQVSPSLPRTAWYWYCCVFFRSLENDNNALRKNERIRHDHNRTNSRVIPETFPFCSTMILGVCVGVRVRRCYCSFGP